MRINLCLLLGCLLTTPASAQTPPPTLLEPAVQSLKPLKAPLPTGLLLRQGDRLAICGDSITEQKMYSRLMEDYLTMCVPQLEVTVRQYGWSGERAPGFLARMTNDCLRFKPTVATTCYGMNDHEYRAYEERIGQAYRASSTAVVEAFKAHGARVIQGSPGCVGKMPSWVKSASGTVEDLNSNLCNLRNIGIEIAQSEKVGFADIFWPMLTAGAAAQQRYSPSYAISGTDGVHPGWAGQTVMAYAFLKALGLKGDLATFTVNLGTGRMITSPGHELLSAKDGVFEIKSSRYPFCGCEPQGHSAPSYPVCETDDVTKDSSIRSAMTLVPFNQDLNRFMLIARHGKAQRYKVVWGAQSKAFSAGELGRGINLAEAFPDNPFSEAFARVDAAVAAKQAYETKQIKEIFHGQNGKMNMDVVAARTEEERRPLAEAIRTAFQPVTHTLRIDPE